MKKPKDTQKIVAGMMPATEELLETLTRIHRPLKLDSLLRIFKLTRRSKRDLENLLDELVNTNKLMRIKGGSYSVIENLRTVTGQLEIQRSGVGYILQKSTPDIFVAPHNLNNAWHGDIVEVALLPTRGKPEGKINKVVERSLKDISVRIARPLDEHTFLCHPVDLRIQARFSLSLPSVDPETQKPMSIHNFGPDDIVLMHLGENVQGNLWEGSYIRKLGTQTDTHVQEELVKIAHSVPTIFPAEVLKQAEQLPTNPSEAEQNQKGRRPLHHIPFVTIDGEDSKDFDDAIYVEATPQGYTLYVAIADVAYYVHPQSPLDKEARTRANSWYFPISVEPMLPPKLSDSLCSLMPDVPRLVMVAEIHFDNKGLVQKSEMYAGCITSAKRLTYNLVQKALDNEPEAVSALAKQLSMLQTAEKLARVLKTQRTQRGSLDFDVPEQNFVFTADNKVQAIEPAPRLFSHKLIEEFMLAANEAVARFLQEKELPFLYRVHPNPSEEKIFSLYKLLQSFGFLHGEDIPKTINPQFLQKILLGAHDTPYEYVINKIALRSMMQARYSPEHDLHFGLASQTYCHFTSPIRRYADLIVHRALRQALGLETFGSIPTQEILVDWAEELNAKERTAQETERDIHKRLLIIYLQDFIGKNFEVIISGVTEFGFFVQDPHTLAEGLVRLANLHDDYYTLDPERQELYGERTGKTFVVGQKLAVILADVSLEALEITFELEGSSVPLGQRRKTSRPAKPFSGAARKEPAQQKEANKDKKAPPRRFKPKHKQKGRTTGQKKD